MRGIVVSLFDQSGEMVKPWAAAGYPCYCFDIENENTVEGNISYIQCDLSTPDEARRIIESDGRKVVFMSAFPPCDDLACSGSRWLKGKGLRALQGSIGHFATAAELADYFECSGFAENPKSTISTYWRPPDYKFHPAQYQLYTDEWCDYTKETWLWAFNDFVMPAMAMEPDLFHEPDKTYIHHQPPGEDRANIRSKTPPGFPQAVFEANRGWDSD